MYFGARQVELVRELANRRFGNEAELLDNAMQNLDQHFWPGAETCNEFADECRLMTVAYWHIRSPPE